MTENNPFDSGGGNRSGLVPHISLVTPSDTVDLPGGTAISVKCKTAAGDVVFTDATGVDVTYPIALDEMLVCGMSRIKATGTTATGLWVFYA